MFPFGTSAAELIVQNLSSAINSAVYLMIFKSFHCIPFFFSIISIFANCQLL